MTIHKVDEKYLVSEQASISVYDLEGSLDSVISYLQNLNTDDKRNARLDIDPREGYSGEGPEVEITLSYDRLATDKEVEKYEAEREKDRERRRKAAKEAREATKRRKEKEKAKALELVRKEFPNLLKDTS